MAKRRAGTELTDRNWENEEEPEDPGQFQAAGNEVLSRRVIRVAKRRVKAGEGDDSPQDDNTKPSPFAGFAFAANKAPTSFSFKSTKTDAPTVTPFSFKPSIPDKPPTLATADTLTVSTAASKLPAFGSAKPSTISTNGTGSSLSTSRTQTPPSTSPSPQYSQKLQNLNRSVSAWIQKHVNENPVCDLTPIFEDYKKHLREIEKLRADNTKDVSTQQAERSTESGSKAPTAISTFSFGKSSDTKQDSKPSDTEMATSTPATFSFGTSDTKMTGLPKSDFSFKVTSATPASVSSGFSFGRSDTAPMGTGFSAGTFEASAAGSMFGSGKPFSLGGVKPSDTATPASAVSKTGNEDDYEPPKEEVKVVQEKDSLYSKRCKIFYKKGDAYQDRGVGMLHLKKTGDTLQLLVRADTNLGNVLLNITLPGSLPVSRQGKNNLLLMTPLNPPVDRTCPTCNKKYPRPQESNACDSGCTPEATALLLRVKTSGDADEAFEKINELRNV
ncbi:nuclear pore complex protein Nup50-like [Patiria miniata]|uniref:Nuclear pore complex NUP2/50/61 domain-containing protein n=1 Tax=Patiria miniata TaxID=46514 RepID=A0A913ZFM4_PATMI|nr:nuclear pore complex protein Nup50-like [Patiria miniata]XP_038050598.1 nuclear pore complex protein Nup50-like [Patiria miniata]